MDGAEVEGTAEALYAEAGFDPREPAAPVRLARALLGPRSVFSVHASSLPGDACLVRLEEQYRIYVRARLEPRRRRFAVLHELAEWHLHRVGFQGQDIESVADALAAALLAPRQQFLRALTATGYRLPILARHFEATESCVALRAGEVTGEPMALIAPLTVRVRGADWSWPTEPELRVVSRGKIPGVRKVSLRSQPPRVVLRVC